MNQLEVTRTVEQWWQHFADIALPDIRKGSVQYLEIREAFYAGLLHMLRVMTESADVNLEMKTFAAFMLKRESEIVAFFLPGGGLYERSKLA